MDYIPGENLYDRICRQEKIAPFEALRMMKQIAMALQYGSELGVTRFRSLSDQLYQHSASHARQGSLEL